MRIFAALTAMVTAGATAFAQENPEIREWAWQQDGVSLRLVQRLPDQTRAFFLGRGFERADADLIAGACIFQSIFRNDGARKLDFDLDGWRIVANGESHSIKTRERWDPVWRERGAPQAAAIAFRWSLLPTRQHFAPGDYNWGMVSFGLAPGSRFDLHLAVMLDGAVTPAIIEGIVCAEDR